MISRPCSRPTSAGGTAARCPCAGRRRRHRAGTRPPSCARPRSGAGLLARGAQSQRPCRCAGSARQQQAAGAQTHPAVAVAARRRRLLLRVRRRRPSCFACRDETHQCAGARRDAQARRRAAVAAPEPAARWSRTCPRAGRREPRSRPAACARPHVPRTPTVVRRLEPACAKRRAQVVPTLRRQSHRNRAQPEQRRGPRQAAHPAACRRTQPTCTAPRGVCT